MKLGALKIGSLDHALDSARAVLTLAAANFEVDHVSFDFNDRTMYVWLEDAPEQSRARAFGQLGGHVKTRQRFF